MNRDDIRAAIIQAEANEGAGCFFMMEIFIIAAFLGFAVGSWWVFGGIFLGAIILMGIKIFSRFLCFALSLLWGCIGFAIGTALPSSSVKILSLSIKSAAIVLGIIAFFFGLAAHMGVLEWYDDMS